LACRAECRRHWRLLPERPTAVVVAEPYRRDEVRSEA
jgi:hypothetical protein